MFIATLFIMFVWMIFMNYDYECVCSWMWDAHWFKFMQNAREYIAFEKCGNILISIINLHVNKAVYIIWKVNKICYTLHFTLFKVFFLTKLKKFFEIVNPKGLRLKKYVTLC